MREHPNLLIERQNLLVTVGKKTVGGFFLFSLVVEVKANLLQHLIFGDGISLVVG